MAYAKQLSPYSVCSRCGVVSCFTLSFVAKFVRMVVTGSDSWEGSAVPRQTDGNCCCSNERFLVVRGETWLRNYFERGAVEVSLATLRYREASRTEALQAMWKVDNSR